MNATGRPKVLVIETSGRVGRVGLADGPELVAEQMLDTSRQHARDLTPAVAGLLRELRWRPKDLGAVFVSLGPGSYTGLRVGIASAKALAFAVGCRAVGVPTFLALARHAQVPGNTLEVIADAQREKLYVQLYSRSDPGGPFAPAGELHVTPTGLWLERRDATVPVIGPGLRVVGQYLPADAPADPVGSGGPSLPSLLGVGWERMSRGDFDSALALEPIYLRPSSAEEQWDRLGR